MRRPTRISTCIARLTVSLLLLLAMPVVSKKVKKHICQEVYNAFGGNLYEVIVGGAPLSKEVEEFLLSIGFPITVGYGTTECAPLISFTIRNSSAVHAVHLLTVWRCAS